MAAPKKKPQEAVAVPGVAQGETTDQAAGEDPSESVVPEVGAAGALTEMPPAEDALEVDQSPVEGEVVEQPAPSLLQQLVAVSREAQMLGEHATHADIEGLIEALHSVKIRLARATTLPLELVKLFEALL